MIRITNQFCHNFSVNWVTQSGLKNFGCSFYFLYHLLHLILQDRKISTRMECRRLVGSKPREVWSLVYEEHCSLIHSDGTDTIFNNFKEIKTNVLLTNIMPKKMYIEWSYDPPTSNFLYSPTLI